MKEWRAAGYDDFQRHHQLLYGQELLSSLGAMTELGGTSVLDLGCGSGELTLRLSELVGPSGRVTAIDLDAGMLDLLRARTAHHNIDIHEADLVAWLQSNPHRFDVIFSNAVLHWLPSRTRFDEVLRDSFRCLSDGGHIALQFSLTGNCEAAKQFLEAHLRTHLGDAGLTLTRSPFDFSSCLSFIQATGFDVRRAVECTDSPFTDKRMSFQWMMSSQPLLRYMPETEMDRFSKSLWRAWEQEQVEVKSHRGVFIARKLERLFQGDRQ